MKTPIEIDYKKEMIFKKTKDGKEAISTFSLKKLGDGRTLKPNAQNGKAEYIMLEIKSGGKTYVDKIRTEDFVLLQSFKRKMSFYGTFLGGQKELDRLICVLHYSTNDKTDYYIASGQFGRYDLDGEDIWIFRNGFYFRDNFYPRKDFLEIEGEKKKGILFEEGGDGWTCAPVFNENRSIVDYDLAPIQVSLSKFFPNSPITMVFIIAFYASTLRYSDFFRALNINQHPVLFLTGETETGKTELVSLLNSLIGLSGCPPSSWHTATPFINQKSAHDFSHLPIWRDEYRSNTGRNDTGKEDFVRSLYDRSGVVKGRSDLSVSSLPVNSTLIITGEDAPTDTAMQRRCLLIIMGKEDKVLPEEWFKIKESSLGWFDFFLYVVNQKINPERAKETYRALVAAFKPHCKSTETNFAYIITVYLEMFCGDRYEERFEILKTHTIEHNKNNRSYSEIQENVSVFVEETLSHIAKNKNIYLKTYVGISQDEKYIRLWLKGMEELLNKREREGKVNSSSLRNQLIKNCKGTICKQKIDGITRHCVEVGLKIAPECISDLALYLEEEEEKIIEEKHDNRKNYGY